MTASDPHRFAKLAGVHPTLATAVRAIVAAMHELGYDMIVTDGFRTVAEQQTLYRQGRSASGKRVTNADGVTDRSNHQSGLAVDCCFLVDGRPSWDEALPWARYGALARAVGLSWGGDWKQLDRPHVEMPVGS